MATPQYSNTREGLTGDLFIDLATTGYRWILGADRTVDWSISSGFNGEFWTDPTAVREYVEVAFEIVSYYANISFNYVGHHSSPVAAFGAGSEINVSLDAAGRFFQSNSVWAIGAFPSAEWATYYPGSAGDIFLNVNSGANSLPSYDPGSSGWTLLLHEIGHTLGLKHPHDNGGQPGRPTMDEVGAGRLDKDWITVMSYDDDYPWNTLAWHPATPMVLDVIALQYLYGANMATNAGDSLFTLGNNNLFATLWDASGIDTLSFATATKGWYIELPNFLVSDLVSTPVGLAVPRDEMSLPSPHSLYWLTGDLEIVQGSAFADEIIGDIFDNRLFGGGGNDTISDLGGVNFLRGEAGNDSLLGGDEFDDLHGNVGDDTVAGGLGGDWVVGGQGNDVLYGGDDASADVVYGNLGNDTQFSGDGDDWIRGGQGHDSLSAGGGADLIWGDRGDDTIQGGAGADVFSIFGEAGNDRIVDFNAAEGDRLRVEPGYTYTVAQVGADVVVSISGGAQATLVGANLSALGTGWIV